MTYLGAPSIYYGGEIAMEGGADPDCRRPFHWTWRDDSGRVEVHDHVRRLAALRKEHPCFALGSFETLLAEGRVYAYRRSLGEDAAVVVLNAGRDEITVNVPVGGRAAGAGRGAPELEDALTGERVEVGEGGALTVTLPPLSGCVYVASD